ncbi:hypothetical protein Pcinc_043449, partial [Petrolisthes cinctipes]
MRWRSMEVEGEMEEVKENEVAVEVEGEMEEVKENEVEVEMEGEMEEVKENEVEVEMEGEMEEVKGNEGGGGKGNGGVLPTSVVISGQKTAVEGERVRLQCTSRGSRPSAELTWFLQGSPVPAERE